MQDKMRRSELVNTFDGFATQSTSTWDRGGDLDAYLVHDGSDQVTVKCTFPPGRVFYQLSPGRKSNQGSQFRQQKKAGTFFDCATTLRLSTAAMWSNSRMFILKKLNPGLLNII